MRYRFTGPQKIKNRPSIVSNWSFKDQGEQLQRKTKTQNGELMVALRPETCNDIKSIYRGIEVVFRPVKHSDRTEQDIVTRLRW